ncbi:transposase [Crocosphaera sp.]|uniref:transposase n=1 Tax=Crocosphaera sp. TaxID=2729996 RepID=UPI003F1F9C2F|nr:transposase [Crocosphaera sp.]
MSQKILPISLKNLKRLGIDEISLVKSHGKFIILLVDLDTGKLIGLVKERKSKTLEEYLESWGNEPAKRDYTAAAILRTINCIKNDYR